MAGCDVLYHDPARAGPGDGWRSCSARGAVWTDPGLVLRFVCAEHRRQLTALWTAGLAIGTPTHTQGGSPCASTPPAST
jgi:hypothetical protein